MTYSDSVLQAYQAAVATRKRAYAPYSKFQVGSAIKLKYSDDVVTGCNIENASFGATICAERSALFSIIPKYGKCELDFVVVVTDVTPAAVPCALCLQALAEFAEPDMPIYLANLQGIEREMKFSDLLPNPFNKVP